MHVGFNRKRAIKVYENTDAWILCRKSGKVSTNDTTDNYWATVRNH